MNKYDLYYNIAKANSGVLFIQGRPAEAKSAIVRKIAEIHNLTFIDLRLSQMDETDIGLFPLVNPTDKCVDHIPPRWAIEANKKPSLVFFDELNRAKLDVRNAALQILLERTIGYNFKFNDDVLMMSAGNYGEEDNTEVEEMDSALWNRLIVVDHKLSIKEWVNQFANENVWDIIVKYINAHPKEFYKMPTENTKAYATPRSWTFLSDFLKTYFGGLDNIKIDEAIPLLNSCASSYIGNASVPFIRFLHEQKQLSVNDILTRYDEFKSEIVSMKRTRVTEILKELESMKINQFSEYKISNLIKFLKDVNSDELASFLFHITEKYISDSGKVNGDNIKTILRSFKTEYNSMRINYGISVK